MNSTFQFKKLLPYILGIFILLIVTFIYFSPVLSGKTLSMYDNNQATGMAKELADYHQKTGEWAWWTNSTFGGMPSFLIAGGYPYNLAGHIGAFVGQLLPTPVNVIFLLMVGFFILMATLKKNITVSILASIAYALGTYNLLYTEAGHISKIIALAYAPPLVAGFILIFRGKYLLGSFVTSFFLAMELYGNHLQITYYFFIILLSYSLYEGYKLIKNGEIKKSIIVVLCLSGSAIIGVGTNAERLWNNLTYSKESTRGNSDLSKTTVGKSGLDKDYAFGWSYGIEETLTLVVPSMMGGGSSGALPKSSETYKTLAAGGVDANMAEQFIQQLPLYFGEQSSTTGPAYSGILIVLLFILGLFLGKDKSKWLWFGLLVLFIMLAWGYHFSSFNDLVFQYVPGYNKFRAVTQTVVIAHFIFVLGAANTLNNLIEEKYTFGTLKKPLIYSIGIILGLVFIGYFSLNFSGANDQNFKESLSQSLGADFANRVLLSIQSDRSDMVFSDIIRGLLLMALLSGLIFFYSRNKIKSQVFGLVAAVLIVYDLFSVGKRYFNNQDFVSKSQASAVLEPTAADLEILKDTDPNYRMINLTTSFWSDARDSYFHKSIGGYHGAKLKKTQELYEFQMVKDGKLNFKVLNMLNTRYFVSPGQNNAPMVQRNPDALGNAWFVDTLHVVNNSDEVMALLGTFQPKSMAIADKSQNLSEKTYSTSTVNSIVLKSYAPNKLVYETNTVSPQFAVFSEIFYRGNIDWISTIDGKQANHVNVNYVLRGMEVPAGKHQVVFEFKPQSVEKGKYIDLASSIMIVLLAMSTLASGLIKRKAE